MSEECLTLVEYKRFSNTIHLSLFQWSSDTCILL